MTTTGNKRMGPGSQGKGDGSGAATIEARGDIGPNQVLSNRDKQQHSKQRGQDSKTIEAQQLQDSRSNQGGE